MGGRAFEDGQGEEGEQTKAADHLPNAGITDAVLLPVGRPAAQNGQRHFLRAGVKGQRRGGGQHGRDPVDLQRDGRKPTEGSHQEGRGGSLGLE